MKSSYFIRIKDNHILLQNIKWMNVLNKNLSLLWSSQDCWMLRSGRRWIIGRLLGCIGERTFFYWFFIFNWDCGLWCYMYLSKNSYLTHFMLENLARIFGKYTVGSICILFKFFLSLYLFFELNTSNLSLFAFVFWYIVLILSLDKSL